MESVYWVLSWACHRRCDHCYDDRFRPYVRDGLERVIAEGERAYERIIAHLPARLRYRSRRAPERERVGRIILAGGEVLLDGVRERVFLPTMDALRAKYGADGAKISVQTTGDMVTPARIAEMLERGVWLIAISGMDDFHVGMEGDKRAPLMAKLRAMMADAGVEEVRLSALERDYRDETGPFFLFFGAEPHSWIGELWPRGRAFANGLSTANYETNFCARRSGAKDFLTDWEGSEVAIEPDGSVYPCCLKTKAPLGSLMEEPLEAILEDLRGLPAIEALNRGDPEGMGEAHGVDREAFRAGAGVRLNDGRTIENPCLGCDRFFETTLKAVLHARREARRALRSRI